MSQTDGSAPSSDGELNNIVGTIVPTAPQKAPAAAARCMGTQRRGNAPRATTRQFVEANVVGPSERAAATAWRHMMQVQRANGQSAEDRLRGHSLAWMYGSDCSGVDAPLFAAKCLKAEAAKHEVSLDVTPGFVSEDPKNPAAVSFLIQNHNPERVYIDMFDRDAHGGFGANGERIAFPRVVDVYVAGTECQEISSGNHGHSPIIFSWDAIATGGVSTRTILQSIRTIKHLAANACLRVFILENVKTLNADALVKFLKEHILGFYIIAIRGNALDIQSESDRDRFFVIGTRKACTLSHPAEWPTIVDQCVAPRGAWPASDFILRCTSPEVNRELERKQGRQDTIEPADPGLNEEPDVAPAPKRRRPSARQSRAYNAQPDKVFEWQKEHQAGRSSEGA
jgi:site-specific DNA-cytosine methylase